VEFDPNAFNATNNGAMKTIGTLMKSQRQRTHLGSAFSRHIWSFLLHQTQMEFPKYTSFFFDINFSQAISWRIFDISYPCYPQELPTMMIQPHQIRTVPCIGNCTLMFINYNIYIAKSGYPPRTELFLPLPTFHLYPKLDI
jgi:hypothetical protein